jgi:Flp pilus assembly protein TadB
MKSLVASNRVIVAQLLGSLDRSEGAVTDVDAVVPSPMTSAGIRLLRHTTPKALRNTAVVILTLSGVLAGSVSAWAGIAVLLLGVCFTWFRLSLREVRRKHIVERDLPALVTSVASSVRAGVDPLRAICDAQEYFPADSLFTSEVKIFQQRLAAGEDEFDVIEKFLIDDSNSEVELFKQCLLLSRRHGSSLSEPLHRVVRTIRQRQSFKRKTRAALAMHRMSAVGIAGCAIVITGMQLMMNVSGVQTALTSTFGKSLIGGGAALIVLGVVLMLRMGREEKL